MSKGPKVTVLMPVYNGEAYLRGAIESILAQTYRDIEFLIINDGSMDNSAKIIEAYNDPRIRLVNNRRNIKLIETLNKGLRIARGEYIARMDCDDISLPRRLEAQIEYLEQHPEVGVLGCRIRNIDLNGGFISEPERPLTHHCNLWVLLFEPSIMHPSVMYRKEIVQSINGYSKDALHSEDYDLWSRVCQVTEIHQLDNVLVHLRKHNSNIGARYREQQLRTSIKISKRNILRLLGGTPDSQTLEDTVRFVKERPVHLVKSQRIYAFLFLIYSRYIANYDLSYNDRKWIAKRFITLMTPLFKLSIGLQVSVILNGAKPLPFSDRLLVFGQLISKCYGVAKTKAGSILH